MAHKPWYIPTRWPDGSDKPKPMGTILNEVLHRLERIEKATDDTPKEPDLEVGVIPETWTVEKHLMNALQHVTDAYKHLDTALYKQRRGLNE